MQRPSRMEFNIGTRSGVAVSVCFAMLALYGWALPERDSEHIPGILVLACLVLVRASAMARERVDSYKAWTGAWTEMGAPERAPEGKARRATPSRSRRRAVLVVTALLCALCLAANQGASHAGVSPWVVGGVGIAGASMVARRRRLTAGPTARLRTSGTREEIVTLCLPVPRTCPGVREVVGALPDYAAALLGRQFNEHASSAKPEPSPQ